ncbi:hypothetical protein EIG99_02715 [Staphylococcus condimenti]|uniref:Capsule synthesis protein CapA domain-containing protein n=2 Tax=Staphylococcus TaxID=1279 RepID=A0A4Q7CP67_9STAP|nr:CapA family protein [Staphylococcus condimenti]RZI02068.1 hypothetical protein EIG98_09355 [Staphylococcus condimenti]RZI03719.1 hypothetical protein EIG99_02715 [Staphylococcus condimenti]
MNYNQKTIEHLLEGKWYRQPEEDWFVDNVVINPAQAKMEKKKGKKVLFIAIDSDTWHKGTGNRGMYAGWTDTHTTVANHESYIDGIIAARPIPELNPDIPQYIIENSYSAIKALANYAYQHRRGQMIAITGTAGKSTSKGLLDKLLGINHTTIATRGNHNTRTGVPLTIACAITQPEFTIVETAISGLWMRSGGILKNYPPDIAMITSIDGGQKKSAHETAILKARIAEGMHHKGHVVLNKDMNEYDTVEKEVQQYNQNIVTYGFDENADSLILEVTETRTTTIVKARILGEEITFETQLNGEGMVQNIVGVLTVIKLAGVALDTVVDAIKDYTPNKAVQNFESYQTGKGHHFTLLNDTWNATGIAMNAAVDLLSQKSKYYKGKSIALLGRIENLSAEEAKKQHESVAQTLIDSNVDIVFAHGPEMKHMLRKLPPEMIGGYYESAEEIASHVANIIEEDDIILLKGSPRSSNFKHVKDELLKAIQFNKKQSKQNIIHPPSTGYGVATFDLESGQKVSGYGNQEVTQNQGIGGLILINHILDRIFAKKLSLTTKYLPDAQAIRESQSDNALLLRKNSTFTLNDILGASIVKSAPNALLMLANTVVGSNRKSMQMIRETVAELGLPPEAALNITGRRISNKQQTITLEALFKVGRLLFNKMPFIQDLLSRNLFIHGNNIFRSKTNLYHYGRITHGLFYGQSDSIGVVLSDIHGKKYVSVVLGAENMFHRDALLSKSIESVAALHEKPDNHLADQQNVHTRQPYKINVIGDTYFGEFYTRIRKRQGKEDALMRFGRNYSFDDIRAFLTEGNFNICNFEAAISDDRNEYLKMRKPFVLHADTEGTVEALKKENIHLATLANNHLMDCGVEGLTETVKQFKEERIHTIGAADYQEEAEKPFVLNVNGQRMTFFNAYWYRQPMYEEFDFYAIGEEPGVACMNPFIFEKIQQEKENHPNGKIIVIAHWGADFKDVRPLQRRFAEQLSKAGADIIIGHGAHMIQGIQKINQTTVAYSIGNGVFNSNGEYNKRFVPAYSMIAQLIISENNEMKLCFYPIYGNNLDTFWKPRFVTKEEFEHCRLMLKARNTISMGTGKDEYYYFEMNI